MTISYAEVAQLTCPSCGSDFNAELWFILDAQENPEQVRALYHGHLNSVCCASCGASGPSGSPLLFHDRVHRQVIFVVAPGVAEHELQEQARHLHSLLVGSIPIDERLPYLNDVQIAQDMAGIARILRKAERLRSGKKSASSPAPSDSTLLPAKPSMQTEQIIPSLENQAALLQAVQALIQADTVAMLQTTITQYPVLLSPDTDVILEQLTTVAFEQREFAIADSLHHARQLLVEIRSRGVVEAPLDYLVDTPPAMEEPATSQQTGWSNATYQALLHAATYEGFLQVVQMYPFLIEPWVDTLLAAQVDLALDEGNERLAQTLEERRERLATIAMQTKQETRQPNQHDPALLAAIEALLNAEDEETMVQVFDDYPVLFTDAAQAALLQFAAEARAAHDEDLATYAVECRVMLRKVREGLEE